MGFSKKKSIQSIWTEALKKKEFRLEFFLSLLLIIFIILSFSQFAYFVEGREGIQLRDPLLNSFSAHNVTWMIFILIYGAVIAGIGLFLYNPYCLTLFIEAYSLMIILRILMMFLIPLDAPEGMIPMPDPFIGIFTTGKVLTRDLFFSGHTATLFLLYLIVPKWKKYFLSLTILVAALLLLQKVHYTIDVVVAPFISFISYFLVRRFIQKSMTKTEP